MTQLTREQVLELFHQRSSTRYYDPTKKSVMKILNVF
ncbi:NAD(P)H-flavin oxidoreductase [Haemophilus influenzae PittHH]|uniref:Dihydropteridine reductase, NAD(P)H-dependent, oxygen-insensitive n=1 Tax=Haemophilus influenzae TaxID=727 RepID=A0A2X1QQC5_HAEIF|nr:NAD(P)H-flavin oxidoreductase [Haemophilus influenzae PittHH]SPX42562.1 dihydropteridine reductase, NAD(P)H-dependent, oxygen-insensitive [Haemophilus influenzae]